MTKYLMRLKITGFKDVWTTDDNAIKEYEALEKELKLTLDHVDFDCMDAEKLMMITKRS